MIMYRQCLACMVTVSFEGQADIPMIIAEPRSYEERQVKEGNMYVQKTDKIQGRQDLEFFHILRADMRLW